MLVKKEWKPFGAKEISFEEAEQAIVSLIAGFGCIEVRYFHVTETENSVFWGGSTYVNKILVAPEYKVIAWFGFAALHGMIFDSVILDDYRWIFCRNETLQDGSGMMSGIEVSAPTAPAQAMKMIEEYEGTDKEVHKTMMHRLGYMLKDLVYNSRRKARLESRAASKTKPKKRRPKKKVYRALYWSAMVAKQGEACFDVIGAIAVKGNELAFLGRPEHYFKVFNIFEMLHQARSSGGHPEEFLDYWIHRNATYYPLGQVRYIRAVNALWAARKLMKRHPVLKERYQWDTLEFKFVW